MNILGSSKCRRKQQLELTWRDGRRCRQGRWGEAPGTCGNFWGPCARLAPHGRERANRAFSFTSLQLWNGKSSQLHMLIAMVALKKTVKIFCQFHTRLSRTLSVWCTIWSPKEFHQCFFTLFLFSLIWQGGVLVTLARLHSSCNTPSQLTPIKDD